MQLAVEQCRRGLIGGVVETLAAVFVGQVSRGTVGDRARQPAGGPVERSVDMCIYAVATIREGMLRRYRRVPRRAVGQAGQRPVDFTRRD